MRPAQGWGIFYGITIGGGVQARICGGGANIGGSKSAELMGDGKFFWNGVLSTIRFGVSLLDNIA